MYCLFTFCVVCGLDERVGLQAMIIALTIIISIIALLSARGAGLTATWLGTGSVTAFVLLFIMTAVPQCAVLFDSLWIVALIWFGATTFYHRILTDARRQTPLRVGRRSGFVWTVGRYTVGVAVGVTA